MVGVAGIADQGQRIALLYAVAFADPQRSMPQVCEDDKMAGAEFDDNDIPRRVRGIRHEVGAFGIFRLVACDDHRCAPQKVDPALIARFRPAHARLLLAG